MADECLQTSTRSKVPKLECPVRAPRKGQRLVVAQANRGHGVEVAGKCLSLPTALQSGTRQTHIKLTPRVHRLGPATVSGQGPSLPNPASRLDRIASCQGVLGLSE